MNPKHQDEKVTDPGKAPLGNIDPAPGTQDPVKGGRGSDGKGRSTSVNDGDVGEERRERDPADPQKNPRTGPIG